MANPGPGGTDPVSGTPAAQFADQLTRTVDRLRSLSLARLGAPFEPEATRADAARWTAQRLADVAAELEGGPVRTLPRLADAAVGDQVAVCGRDVLAAAPGDSPLLVDLADELLELRRRL